MIIKDHTKTITYSEDSKIQHRMSLEDRYCICSEPGGKYLLHFVNNPEEWIGLTLTEHISQQLLE